MEKPSNCRSCRTGLTGAAYVMLPGLKGGGRVCLSCADKAMVHHGQSLREFAVAYRQSVRPDTVQSLKERVKHLEAMLKLNGLETL